MDVVCARFGTYLFPKFLAGNIVRCPTISWHVVSNHEHYHAERNHQGLDNEIIDPDDRVGATVGEIACRERLGGMLKYYHRTAA